MAVHIHPRPAAPAAPRPQGPALPEQDIVVNDAVITAREVAAEMQHHPADTAGEAWEAAARALVVRRLLLDAAQAAGIAGAEDELAEDEAIGALLAREITIPAPDDAACRRWFAAHPERFGRPEAWEASHILIAADPEVAEERAHAEAQARELLAQLTAAPWRLAELARLHSGCPSRDQGGDLGRIARGSTVPEFEAALAGAEAGQVLPDVVATRYGMHVVLLHRHLPARPAAFEDVADQVARDLARASWEAAARQLLGVLAARARIEGYAFDGAASGPLVQ